MPVKPVYIEVPAVIRKSDIEVYCRLRGCTNSEPLIVNREGFEFTFQPRTARFATFAGALDQADGLYHGVYRFERGEFKDPAEACDLSTLPGLSGPETITVPVSGEPNDGV